MTVNRPAIRSFAARLLIYFGLTAACALGWSTPASADQMLACDPVSALGVTRPAADFVLLVDVSHTMDTPAGNLYREARSQLRSILSYLFPDDRVTLISFAREAKTLYDGPAGRNPEELLAKLPTQVASTVTGAEGALTDTGAALDAAVQVLKASGRPRIATMVIFTDGRLDKAPSASRYANPSGAAWQLLQEQASTIEKEVFEPYYSPLTADAGGPTIRIFPRARPLSTGQVDLKAQIGNARDGAFLKASKNAAMQQMRDAIDVRLDGAGSLVPGNNPGTLVFTSSAESLTISIGQIQATSDDQAVSVVPAATAPFQLKPGESATVPMDLIWTARTPNWSFYDIDDVHASVEVTAVVQSDCDDALSKELQIRFDWALGGGSHDVSGRTQLGQPLVWSVIGAAGIVCLVIFMLVRPTKMAGTLVATTNGERLGKVALRGRRMRLPDQGLVGQGMLKLGNYGEALVRGRRRWAAMRGATGVSVQFVPKAGDRPASRCALPPGAAGILYGIEFSLEPDATLELDPRPGNLRGDVGE